MNVRLTLEQEQFIEQKLKTGKYETVTQVITEAFRLLEARDQDYQQWIEETRAKVDQAIASLERGEGIDGEEAVAQLLEKIAQV